MIAHLFCFQGFGEECVLHTESRAGGLFFCPGYNFDIDLRPKKVTIHARVKKGEGNSGVFESGVRDPHRI